MLLGEDDFVDKMTEHIKKHKDIPEIPRSLRFANRPSLEKIFNETTLRNNKERDCAIVRAVEEYGYRQREIADHLGMYFT